MTSILFCAPWVPSLLRPRSLGLLQELSDRCRVTLVCQTWSGSESRDLAELAADSGKALADVIEVRESRVAGAVRASTAVFSRESLQRAFVNSRGFRRTVRIAFEATRPDIVYFNVLRGSVVDEPTWNVKRVIDLDEFRSSYFDQTARIARNPMWRLIGRLETSRQVAAEQHLLGHADRILVSSPSDIPPGAGITRLVRSPHQLDGDSKPDSAVSSSVPDLCMIGRFSYRANADAASWLLDQVMPLVWAHRPEVVVRLVGADPGPALRRRANSRVEVTGRVRDVGAYYRTSWLNVIPVTTATGVQMKLIEASHFGTPSVVTPVVARGAGVTDGESCAVADSAKEWATKICWLLEDAQARGRIGAAAARWVNAEHSRSAVRSQLWAALDGLVEPGAEERQ